MKSKTHRRELCDIDRDIFQLEEIAHRCEERILARRERKQKLWDDAFFSDDYEKFTRYIREAEQLTAHDEHELAILQAAQERINALREHLLMMIQLQNAEAKHERQSDCDQECDSTVAQA